MKKTTANIFLDPLSLFLFEGDFKEVWKRTAAKKTANMFLDPLSLFLFEKDFREVCKELKKKQPISLFALSLYFFLRILGKFKNYVKINAKKIKRADLKSSPIALLVHYFFSSSVNCIIWLFVTHK